MSQVIVVHLIAVAAMIAVLHYPRPDRKIWVIRFVGLVVVLTIITCLVWAFGFHPLTFIASAFILLNFLMHLAQMVVCKECGGVTLAEFAESTDLMTHHRVDCSQLLRQQRAAVVDSNQIAHPARELPRNVELVRRSPTQAEFVFRRGVGFWSILLALFATAFAIVPTIITLGVLGVVDIEANDPIDISFLSSLALCWLVVGGFYLASAIHAFSSTTFRFTNERLEVETRFSRWVKRTKIEKAAVSDISQISLGYIDNGHAAPVWALRVKQGRRTTWPLKRTEYAPSAWLGKAISRWTGVPVRLLQRREHQALVDSDDPPKPADAKRSDSNQTATRRLSEVASKADA